MLMDKRGLQLVRKELKTAVDLCENGISEESRYQLDQLSQTQLGRLVTRIYGKQSYVEAIQAKREEYESLLKQQQMTKTRRVVRRNAAIQVKISSTTAEYLDVSDISSANSNDRSFDTSFCDSINEEMGSHKAEVASKISGDQLINWTKSVPSRFHATAADEQSAESDSSRSAPLISTSLAANSGCGDYLDISEAQQSQESRKETQLDGETKGTATVTPAKVFSEAQNQVVPTPSRSQLVGDKSNDTEDTVADEELQYDSDFVVEEKEEDDTNLPQLSVRKQPEDFATQLQTIIELIRSGEAEPKTSGKVPRVIEIKDEEVQCLKELSDKDTQYSPGARLAESSGTVGQKKLLTKFNAVMESFESQQISLATKSAQTDGLADRTAKGAQTEAQSVSLAKEFLDRASSTANTSDQHSFAISTDSSSSQSLSSGEISLNRLKDILPQHRYEEFLKNVTFLHFDENDSTTSEGEIPLIKQVALTDSTGVKRPTVQPYDGP